MRVALDAGQAAALHGAFEYAGIALGAWLYRRALRGQGRGGPLQPGNFAVVVGLLLGAALGNKAVFLVERPDVWQRLLAGEWVVPGQSIVGGLLGGLAGVELAKRMTRQSRSTGDALVLPLVAGIAVGRIGCVFAGLHDDTSGVATNLDADAAAGDYFVLQGTSGSSTSARTRYQMMGLAGIISDANTPIEGSNGLQGLPVATYPEFVAYETGDDSAPVDLAVKDMQAVLGELDLVAGGDEGGADGIKLILTSQQGYETVAELFRTERIQVRDLELDGGFTGIAFNGRLPIVADKDVRRGAFYFWNPSSTRLFVLQDWDWEDADGSMFYRLNGGDRDALGATLKAYMEFGVIQRNANAALIGRQMIR